ncbi:hypothetical protein TWF730_002157 [Orbilia blumenaviensis]|uniref:DUF7492 domain-containing protein n=1 Tax=Orbilia blumenaviensis TaxID=1796055 RepID=A0AAV9UI67_9PEZI
MDFSLKVSSLLGLYFPLVIFVLLTGAGVDGHSWVDELTCASGPFFTSSPAKGYIRNFVGRQSTEIDTATTFRILDLSSNQPVCPPGRTEPGQNEPNFPKLQATPGDLIKASYLENGHIWQTLAGINGPQAKPGTIYWYGTQNPKADRDIASVLEWTRDGKGGDGEGVLLEVTPFDDRVCIETGHEDAGEGRVGGACSSYFRLPKTAEVGKDFTVYWLWDYTEHFGPPKPGYLEWYSSCMDISVVSKAEARDQVKNARRDAQPLPTDSTSMKGLNRHLRRRQIHNEKKSSWFSW